MRAWLAAFLLAFLFVAAPALAQVSPSPCDWPVRTGAPLPRQDTARSDTYLTAEPNPTWRSRKIAYVLRDEPVTVLRECGVRLFVRTVRREEGWVATVMFPAEVRLLEAARRRPATDATDCAARFADEALVARCREELAARQALEMERRTAPRLAAGEIPAYVTGRTLVLTPRTAESGDDPRHPPRLFFTGEGEVFIRVGDNGRWRGRWTLEGDRLCLPGAGMPCVRFRRLPGERMVWETAGTAGREWFIARSEGDTAGIVPFVSEAYPTAKPPPAPKGSEPFALPSLGRS